MTSTTPTTGAVGPRPPKVLRGIGYTVGVAGNLLLLWAVNVWPGWEAVPFVTDEGARVVGFISLSLIVSLLVNVVWMVADPPRIKALGDVVNAVFAFVVLDRLRAVFPFDVTSTEWVTGITGLLILGMIATAIGGLVAATKVVTGRR